MILVAGSSNLDFVVQAPHIPAPGETVLGRGFKTFPGGKGANQAVACARAGGVATTLLTALGQDPYAAAIELSLHSANVTLNAVCVAGEQTGVAFICVSDDAENAITVAPGANACLQPEHLPTLHGVSHLLMQLEVPLATVCAYARAARRHNVAIVLNAAPAQALPAELLADVDVLVVNEGELTAILRGINAEANGTVVQCLEHSALEHVPCVVVTLGHRGCCARVGKQLLFQPAFAVNPVDTTAAGDSFCGTLVAALSQGLTMQQALALASAAGALACTLAGAQSSIPSAQDVASFLAQQPQPNAAELDALRRFCGSPAGTPF